VDDYVKKLDHLRHARGTTRQTATVG
jgi:hypothetical protein